MNIISNLNVLILFHSDSPYLIFHFDYIKKYFRTVSFFAYQDFFIKNGIESLEYSITETIKKNKIDVVFIFQFEENFELRLEFLKKIKKYSKIIFWLFDDELLLQVHSKYYAQLADGIIVTDYFSNKFYESIGIPSVLYFSSYSKNDYFHIKKCKKDIDVSFIGACTKTKNNRMSYIEYLIENNVNIQTYGSECANGFISQKEMNFIFNRSKINLNFTGVHLSDAIKPIDPISVYRNRQAKGRPIEIALTKSFCLSEFAPQLNYMFNINSEIDVFFNKEDLLKKIKYYLKNIKIIDKMSNKAYLRAIKNYESDIYMEKVLTQIIENVFNHKIYYSDEIYRSEDFKISENFFYKDKAYYFLINRYFKEAKELFKFINKYEVLNLLIKFLIYELNYYMRRIIKIFYQSIKK